LEAAAENHATLSSWCAVCNYVGSTFRGYLRQGGYVMVVVCLFICLSVCMLATLRKNF